jgi:thiamine-phosphate pyrophosphorylase
MNPEIYSALDANINRGIEGIRVCEDIFRFSLKNPLSAEFKNLRHKITQIISCIPSGHLLSSRDVVNDKQKFVNTVSEMKRESIKDIFRSNIRRAIEASRVIEEFSKSIHPDIAAGFQEVRFSLYDLEKRGWLLLEKSYILDKMRFSLYAIVDSAFVPADRMLETSRILACSGAEIIQLRMKDVPDREFLSMAEKISAICRENDTLFIVNDRVDIAMLSDAHGIHVGQDDIPVSLARIISGDRLLTGISTCSAAEAAIGADADYIAIGPVFSTSSKDGSMLNGVGVDVVKEICCSTDKPVVAIGGITDSNAGILMEAGVSSLSVISALYKDGKIEENTRRLSDLIKSYRVVK